MGVEVGCRVGWVITVGVGKGIVVGAIVGVSVAEAVASPNTLSPLLSTINFLLSVILFPEASNPSIVIV